MYHHVAINNFRICGGHKLVHSRRYRKIANHNRMQAYLVTKAFNEKPHSNLAKQQHQQGYEKWVTDLRDVILHMVQETIASEENSASKFQSEIEEQNKLEYVKHVNFELVVILRKLLFISYMQGHNFDSWVDTINSCISVQTVSILFNTNNFDKVLKQHGNVSFLSLYEGVKTNPKKEYESRVNKVFLQFKTLQELPERVKRNPDFYKKHVAELNRLMYSSPITFLQHFQFLGRSELFMWMAIYSLFLGMSILQKDDRLFMNSIFCLEFVFRNMGSYEPIDDSNRNRILFLCLKLMCNNIGANKESQLTLENSQHLQGLLDQKHTLIGFYMSYLEGYGQKDAKLAYTLILRALLFFRANLKLQFFQILNFDDGIAFYDIKQTSNQAGQKNQKQLECSEGWDWEYARHVRKQIPVLKLTWVTRNESILASLGTPLLNVAMMMLRLAGLIIGKKALLPQEEVEECEKNVCEFRSAKFSLELNLKELLEGGKNVEAELHKMVKNMFTEGLKNPGNENLQKHMLEWVYDQFFRLGGISLLIAVNNYRTQTFERRKAFDVDDLVGYLKREKKLLGEEGEDKFFEDFMLTILEEQLYGDEIREEIMKRRYCVPQMIDGWMLWLQDFQEIHRDFISVWRQLPKSWDDIDFVQFGELQSSAAQLTKVWIAQPEGMPFFEEVVEGLAEAMFVTAAYMTSWDVPAHQQSSLFEQSAKIVQIKMIYESQDLRDINTDMLCILGVHNILSKQESLPLTQMLDNKLSQMSVQSPFTRAYSQYLFYYYLMNNSLEAALKLVKLKKWKQERQGLVFFSGFLQKRLDDKEKEKMKEMDLQLLYEIYEQFLLLECIVVTQQQMVFCMAMRTYQYFPNQVQEILLCKVVKNFAGSLQADTAELLLNFAPDVVLDVALESKEDLRIFKLALCKLIVLDHHRIDLQQNNLEISPISGLFWSPLIQDYVKQDLLKYSADETYDEVKQLQSSFQGDVIGRGIHHTTPDTEMIVILLQLLEVYYTGTVLRKEALYNIITTLNKHDVIFSKDMFEMIAKCLQKWEVEADSILSFLVEQKNVIQKQNFDIIDDVLELQLMVCLRSRKHHMHAYNNIHILNDNPSAQIRILTALFNDDQNSQFEIEKIQLIQWVTKLQSVVPNACVQCDKLLSFLSVIDDSLDWITRYATPTQINQIICSNSCGAKFKHELVQYSLQNNLLQQKSCDYLLQQQNLSQDQIYQLIQYVSDQNFTVEMNALKNICYGINSENINLFKNLNQQLINGLILATYKINVTDKTLLLVDSLQNFVFDWRGLTGYMLALKQQNYENNQIFDKISPCFQQDTLFNSFYYQTISEISGNDIMYVFDIIFDQQPKFCWQIYSYFIKSPLKLEKKVQLLLPYVKLLIQEMENNQEKDKDLVNRIFDYAVQINYPSHKILQVVEQVLQFQPGWKFNQVSIFHFTKQLLNENKYCEITNIFQPKFLNFQQSIEQNQWEELFHDIFSKFQNGTCILTDDLFYFLNLFFNFQIKDKSEYLFQICILLINKNSENIVFVQKLLSKTFDHQISNTEYFIKLLDKFSEIEAKPKLPEPLLLFLDENIESLTSQMSVRTLSYCVESTQNNDTQICSFCYEVLHSKHKHEITPQIWKAALANTSLQENFEKGFEILQHVPNERRMKEKQWQLNIPELQSAEIILEIKGGQDYERGWDLITQFWNDSGVIPQKEIKVLLKILMDQQNPHNCGVMVEKVMDRLQPYFSKDQIEVSTLFVLIEAVTCSDQSFNREEAIVRILSYLLVQKNKINADQSFQNFLSQCLVCNSSSLPVIVVIALSQGMDLSNDILDAVDYDENSQKYLNEWFQCEFLELVYSKSMDEIQSMAQKQKPKAQNYLKSQLNSQQGDGKLDLSGYEDIKNVEWSEYTKSQWLLVLQEHGMWKQWSLEKLLNCAQKLRGAKLKQHKQKRELIQIIEMEQTNILARP